MVNVRIALRGAALASVAVVALAACSSGSSGGTSASNSAPASSGGTPSASVSQPSGSQSAAAAGVKGGTITMLTNATQIQDMDPQRAYTGEDLAFLSAYLTRGLETYQMSTDGSKANSIIPDMATDTGTSTNGAKTWAFTLKDGIKWQDGSPVTCADIKYGVSRTFATDIIVGGPTYAIQYLDIPTNAKDGSSIYKGPYVTNTPAAQAAFDKAVTCSTDNKTITFNLSKPVGDFNYTMTLGFGAVPKAHDTKAKYTDQIWSDGPYMIQSYVKGNHLTLVRNPNWDPASDSWRPAYPDKIIVKFGVDPSVRDQTLIKDGVTDKASLSRDAILTANLPTVFGNPAIASRAFNGLDAYSYYIAVDVLKVPDLKQRMAMAVALDRGALLKIAGGSYAGGPGDGAIKPNIGQDYAPTGLWDGLLGKKIPINGDPAYAKQLIQESGKPMPAITYSYSKNPDADKAAAAIQLSLGKAGIKVSLNPIPPGQYYGTIFNKDRATALMNNGWGPDWPNASTVIPPLYTIAGGWDVSYVDDQAGPDVAGTQQGGSEERLDHPDPFREVPGTRRLQDQVRVW
jgi:peptide/nickel transport system substrate-binding protein